ncbi:MAG: AIPR family protein [Chloroflexi bacterium]|nr:AIPR family protein [Chloroflexota bacterium]
MSQSAYAHQPSQVIKFSVGSKEFLRRIDIEPPREGSGGVTIYHMYPTLDHWLGREVPDDVNPRSHEENALKGAVPQAIERTLKNTPGDFYLANRGETVLAKAVQFDPQSATVEIVLSECKGDDAIHGVADGGTTDAVIARVQKAIAKTTRLRELPASEVPDFLRRARIHLEVIVGLEDRDRIQNLVQGRNTSRQVKSWTLEDFKGSFDWIRDIMERPDSDFAGRIGYEENADKDVNILEILCILTLFHKQYDSKGRAPTVAYSSKGRMDSRLRDDDLQPGYKALAPILEDILRLHDHVYATFFAAYKKARPGGRPGRRGSGEDRIFPAEARNLPLTGKKASHTVPSGVLYPLLQSLRALVTYDSSDNASWRTDPIKFFDHNSAEIMDNLLGQLDAAGDNPQTLGKTRIAYTALYDRVSILAYQQLRA